MRDGDDEYDDVGGNNEYDDDDPIMPKGAKRERADAAEPGRSRAQPSRVSFKKLGKGGGGGNTELK
jgi:hypothetical protein